MNAEQSDWYLITIGDHGVDLWRDYSRYTRATESAYWHLKPYRTRWQRFCLRQAKRLPWGTLKLWLLRQAKA